MRARGLVVLLVACAGCPLAPDNTLDAAAPRDDLSFTPLDATWPGDAGDPPASTPVATHAPHWQLAFVDDFRGKTGKTDDAYCYDQLAPQCTVWPGSDTNDCDLSDVMGPGFYPPRRENLMAALGPLYPGRDLSRSTTADIEALYSTSITQRLASLDKCAWSIYQMVNWMATDYAGNWSARFDASRVTVDPAGKGYLELSATYAPVTYDCVNGGTLGGPNCNVWSAQPGQLTNGVHYWADADPRWPGVYYAPTGGACPVGGTFTGVNCQVVGFPPHLLEEAGVTYWVDADPRWPGVYYANHPYRCKDNIDYSPTLGFRNLTCPILDGAVMSMTAMNRPSIDHFTHTQRLRGYTKFQGRFEVKARIPKGVGAFPAAWLLPSEGGWPYVGGEIDILEARDNADEAYQTYHHGKCYDGNTGKELPAKDSAECDRIGGKSVHLSVGFTAKERAAGEFWNRDHVYSVEWTDGKISWFVNNTRMGTMTVGTTAKMDPSTAPAALAPIEASNFPTQPFYWILNHSTYVPPAQQAAWAPQTFLIDYVRAYGACAVEGDYCPCGGRFVEGVGCTLAPGHAPVCPAGVPAPTVNGGIYASPCAPAHQECPNGGTVAGARCLVQTMAANQLRAGVRYWVDADPKWPGVYYAKVNGACPYGGAGTVNCELLALPADLVESGVAYVVDGAAAQPGIYYTPDFR